MRAGRSSSGRKLPNGRLLTHWAPEVTPESILPEYPRPQMVRPDRDRPEWLNLNGVWEYAVRPREESSPAAYEGSLLVPFPIESALSRVERALQPDERLWYRRSFHLPQDWNRHRLLLHFGAVDWETVVSVNGREIGCHRGGYDPFSFDITGAVVAGENELRVAVWDPTDRERGKQSLRPRLVFYSAASGIWQTVWLEPVPWTYINSLRMIPDIDAGRLALNVQAAGAEAGLEVQAQAYAGGVPVARTRGPAGRELSLEIPGPQLWSPASPFLYDLEIILEKDGQVFDRVSSYFGMRKFNLGSDAQGRARLMLNNRPFFHLGPLDQGYWPDGIYTAPTDAALVSDLETCKRLGFNTIRKHVKVEPARWYYHCDRLGLVVWQDMPNGGPFSLWTHAVLPVFLHAHLDDRRYRRFGRQAPEGRAGFRQSMQALIDSLFNCPCIGMWIPFNEGWGQFDSRELGAWVKSYDPSRLVDAASGWFDQGAGDVQSFHIYSRRLALPRPDPSRAAVLSEIGGYGLRVEDHLWQSRGLFSYSRSQTGAELTAKYTRLLSDGVGPLAERGLSGAIYTQLTDVEGEINGFLTYDREVMKMNPDQVAAANRSLAASTE